MTNSEYLEGLITKAKCDNLKGQFAARFYELLYRLERKEISLLPVMEKYNSIHDFFQYIKGISSNPDEEILQVQSELEEVIYDRFYHAEDEMLHEVQEEPKFEVYKKFDAYRDETLQFFMDQNPKVLYEEGRGEWKEQYIEKGLPLTEEEFMTEYISTFPKKELKKQLAYLFYNSIENHKKYAFEETSSLESILVEQGRLSLEDYNLVFEFLPEYTGERIFRVMSKEEIGEKEADWGTYESYFLNILHKGIADHLVATLKKLYQEKSDHFYQFAKHYGIEEEEFFNPETIRMHCGQIHYELTVFEDKLWVWFIESEADKIWEEGKQVQSMIE